MTPGARDIADERSRQLQTGRSTNERDDVYEDGDLWMAAICYAFDEQPYKADPPQRIAVVSQTPCGCDGDFCPHPERMVTVFSDPWPWDIEHDKRRIHTRRRQLVIAGALLAAEIDRLDRAAEKGKA